jgi:hypothetical protein
MREPLITLIEKKIIPKEASWLQRFQSAQNFSPLSSFYQKYLFFFIRGIIS